jgi:hypothetical protein
MQTSSGFIALLCTLLAFTTVACSNSTEAANGSANVAQRKSVMFNAADAFNSGKLKFEIRGLQNESEGASYGTVYRHKGMIVTVGDPQYIKGVYLLVCSVKRIGGGDPEHRRIDDWFELLVIRDGFGRIDIQGGYRPPSEKWEPERIELRPVAVFSGVTINAEPVQEK